MRRHPLLPRDLRTNQQCGTNQRGQALIATGTGRSDGSGIHGACGSPGLIHAGLWLPRGLGAGVWLGTGGAAQAPSGYLRSWCVDQGRRRFPQPPPVVPRPRGAGWVSGPSEDQHLPESTGVGACSPPPRAFLSVGAALLWATAEAERVSVPGTHRSHGNSLQRTPSRCPLVAV